MEGKRVIGVHLRGKFIYNEVAEVPIEILCEEANQYAGSNTIFLVTTDQTPLFETAKKLLNVEVIFYDTFRQDTTTSPQYPAQCTPQMGEDVLIDAKLLSLCDHFIHTISSMSTAVLYFNPDLSHTMLYCSEL